MSGTKKVLRFVVTGALLGAPLAGCGADETPVNEPYEEPVTETINEPVEHEEPVVEDQDPINEPPEDEQLPVEETDDGTAPTEAE